MIIIRKLILISNLCACSIHESRFWRLSLPIGGSLDHPLANPFGPSSPNLAGVALDPILVVVGGDEILRDRVEEYARRLKVLRKKIEYVRT
jgi:acetyl esterase/lipase